VTQQAAQECWSIMMNDHDDCLLLVTGYSTYDIYSGLFPSPYVFMMKWNPRTTGKFPGQTPWISVIMNKSRLSVSRPVAPGWDLPRRPVLIRLDDSASDFKLCRRSEKEAYAKLVLV
jgi:hypothetical protein